MWYEEEEGINDDIHQDKNYKNEFRKKKISHDVFMVFGVTSENFYLPEIKKKNNGKYITKVIN